MRRTAAFGPTARGAAPISAAQQLPLPWPLQCVAWPGAVLPPVPKAPPKLLMRDRLSWVLGSVALYLLVCQLPLLGTRGLSNDPLERFRSVLASRRGTMLDLGLLPLLSAYLGVYLLNCCGMVDFKRTDPCGLTNLRRSLAIAIAGLQGVFFLVSGAYSNSAEGPALTMLRATMILVQLEVATMFLTYMDEVLLAGYGVAASGDTAGGLALFATVNVCGSFVTAALSPFWREESFEGALLSFLHALVFRRSNKLKWLANALFRLSQPSLWSLLVAVAIFAGANILKCYRIELTLNSSRARGISATFPVRLFTTAAVPLLLSAAICANVDVIWGLVRTFVPQFGALSHFLPKVLVKLFAKLFYIAIVPLGTFVAVRLWLDSSDQAPEEIAGMLRAQGVVVKGYRGTGMTQLLTRLIEPSVDFGAAAAAALVIASDFLGGRPTGLGVLIAVCTFHGYYELFGREHAKTYMNG